MNAGTRGPRDQTRPWVCTDEDAVFCPIHGDCTCTIIGEDQFRHPLKDDPTCPLHGSDTTHPDATELKK